MDIKKTTLAVLAGVMVSGGAWGTESQLGTTSFDTTTIEFGIKGGNGPGDGGSILIANLEPIDLGDFGSVIDGQDIVGDSDFCVYRTGAGTGEIKYKLTATNDEGPNGDSSAFLLKDEDGTKSIDFTASYYGQSNKGGSPTDFTYNATPITATATQNGTLTGSFDGGNFGCSGDNASLEVSVAFEDALKAEAGEYSSILTLTVEPL